MKPRGLSTLSLALFGAAGVAHAQNSVTLYGTIDTSITYVHNATAAGKNLWAIGNTSGGDLARSRWGLKGQEELGGALKAIFLLENGFNPPPGTFRPSTRQFSPQPHVAPAPPPY